MHQALLSLHVGSLEITLTVPLSCVLFRMVTSMPGRTSRVQSLNRHQNGQVRQQTGRPRQQTGQHRYRKLNLIQTEGILHRTGET